MKMRIEHQDREWIRRREQAREWGPAGSRKYGNPAMLGIFTEETREKTYRTLWWKWARALANAGVGIPGDLLYNMEKLQDEEIDWERLDELREERGHELWTHASFGYSIPRRNGKNEVVAIREMWEYRRRDSSH